MDENIVKLDGIFVYTLYNSNNYMVSKFETSDGDVLTVIGPSVDYELYTKYSISGEYVTHPKYGYQFKMLTISKYVPTKKEDIIRFLSGPSFKGVGKKAALKIYDALGDDALNILKNNRSVLENIDLTNKQIRAVYAGLDNFGDEVNDILYTLISAGFTSSEAKKIFNHFKDDTPLVFKDNPYRFYLDVYGISFIRLSNIVKDTEIENKEFKFKEAYLVYIFKEVSFKNGDIYLSIDDFRNYYLKRYPDFEKVLEICLKDKYLTCIEDRYYLTSDLDNEKYIATALLMDRDEIDVDNLNLDEAIKDSENYFNINYDDKQKEAITSFFKEKISLIIGGPGTGKTTLITSLVNIFKDFFPYNNIIVVAPTGRAAKRINEVSKVESKTIHSLLKWNKEDDTFIHDEDNPILYDCLIIDEFSMVDSNLFTALLKASSYIKKICIIGDNKQLPPIRQGDVLRDLINSNKFKVTYLDTNHRQKEGNDIIELSNDIYNNCVDFDKYQNDVEFIDINNLCLNDIVNIIDEDIKENDDNFNMQVLSPMYKNEFGIDSLNNLLQSYFNPPSKDKKEKTYGKYTFRENDKILELKNRPTDDVYNGDIGTLMEIDEKDKSFFVNYQTVDVFYNFEDLNDISLAYALSVHKAQGSEYQNVYFIFDRSQRHMLYKKLIYTAVSRAKKKLVLIGDKSVFFESLKKEIKERKTSLNIWLDK